MQQDQNRTTFASENESESDDVSDSNNNSRRVFLLLLLLVVVAGAVTFLVGFTVQGQKIINNFNPTAERTLSIMEQLYGVPETYVIQPDGEDSLVLGGVYYDFTTSSVELGFDSKAIAPSSTISTSITQRKLVFIDGEIYISEVYGDNFIPIADAYLGQNTIVKSQELKELLSTNINELLLNVDDQYTIESDVNNFFIKISHTNNPWLVFDKKTYELKNILLSSETVNVTLSPEFETVSTPEISFSQFGDIFARESVLVRTEEYGSFDELWHVWEDFYYDCFRCVYKLGDDDDDGIDNATEFILGTNPNQRTDSDDLQYPNEISNFFLEGGHYQEENGGRTGIAVFEINVPASAKALTFEYQLPLAESDRDYLGLYLDGSLQALLKPTEGTSTQRAAVPLPPEVMGTSSELAIVFNSYGRKGKKMDYKNISYLEYDEERSVVAALQDSGYTVLVNRSLLVEQIPLLLAEGQWSNSKFSELNTIPAEQNFASHYEREIPAITLTATNNESVGVIKRRIDEPSIALSEICISVNESEKNGFIEFQFLPDGSNEYELINVYDLDTLDTSGFDSPYNQDFVNAHMLLSEKGPGTLVIAVFSNDDEKAAATFANFEYYTEETWDLAFRHYGSVDSICRYLNI